MGDGEAQLSRWHVFPKGDELQDEVARAVAAAAQRAIADHGAFHLVLAGGSTPKGVYERLRRLKTNWAAWYLYFGDERCLPADHPDRNSRMAFEAWLEDATVPRCQIYMMPGELGAERGAEAYRSVVANVHFDLVLLGLGEDGHTASLFPGQDLGVGPDAPSVIPVRNAPKPPPERISLSARRLSDAKQVFFLVAGTGKAAAVAQWRKGKSIPAAVVTPPGGVDIYIDQSAFGISAA